MKQFIFLSFVFILFINDAIAQENDKTRVYEVRSSIPVWECNVIGNRAQNNTAFDVPPYGARFAIIRFKNDSVIVRFLRWTGRDSSSTSLRNSFNDNAFNTNSDGSLTSGSSTTENKYFLMTRYDLDSNCIKAYVRWHKSAVFTLGLVTMPMKIRLGKNFDFQGNLSLGTTAGAKIRTSRYNANYVNLLFGASLSTISLDSFSTRGKITGQPLTNIAVFSPSLGVVFEFGKAQAGIFYGWDFLNKSTQTKYDWIYNRKPWISIGFGFSIFSIDSKSSNQNERTQ